MDVMSIIEIVLIGVALATDAFAITISNCTAYKNGLTKKRELSMPITFALFQFLMPVVGFYLGSFFSGYIAGFSKYLTALIFFILAIKIVIDALLEKKNADKVDNKPKKTAFSFYLLLVQGVATSIDALFIGITFSASLSVSVFIASLIIGVVTFIIVSGALVVGKRLGGLLGKYAVVLGAVILFILAVKNLIEGIIG